MDGMTRRQRITAQLEKAEKPISATALAKEYAVSRQLIVGDIALLRAGGLNIAATPRGYCIEQSQTEGVTYLIACCHSGEEMEAELNLIVDFGGEVMDVVVEHPVYGQLVGQLCLSNRYEVSQFVQKVRQEQAKPLSELTGGIHLHRVRCPDEAVYQRILQALDAKGYLLCQR